MATIYDDTHAYATYANGSGAWSYYTSQSGWQNTDLHATDGVAGRGQKVTWNIPITAGVWDIWVSHKGDSAHAPDVPCSVNDGGSLLGTVTVNQSVAPVDLSDNGVMWFYVGQFTFAGTTMTVEMTDSIAANKFVVCDGIRINAVTGTGGRLIGPVLVGPSSLVGPQSRLVA